MQIYLWKPYARQVNILSIFLMGTLIRSDGGNNKNIGNRYMIKLKIANSHPWLILGKMWRA